MSSTATATQTRYVVPGGFTRRVFNPLIRRLTRWGLSIRGSRELAVRGRKSGEWKRVPVNPLDLDGTGCAEALGLQHLDDRVFPLLGDPPGLDEHPDHARQRLGTFRCRRAREVVVGFAQIEGAAACMEETVVLVVVLERAFQSRGA